MEQLSRIKDFLEKIYEFLIIVGKSLVRLYNIVWTFLQIRIPLFKALVRRHVRNPSTVIVDFAIFILAVYIAFGITGSVLVYPKKTETRFAETLSGLYPLPAARINGSFIWSHRFLERLRFLNTFNANAPKDTTSRPPSDKDLRARVLEGVIQDQIIYLEAKKRGIRVTNEELDIAFNKQGKPEEIGPKIEKLYGMSVSQFKEIIAEQVLKEKVKDTTIGKIRIRHILTLDQASANAAKKQLDGGADFAAIAKEFSQDKNVAETGGDLGYWRRGELAAQFSDDFENKVFGLAVNQISDPIQSKFGFQIVQLTEKVGDNTQTFDAWYSAVIKTYKIKKYISI